MLKEPSVPVKTGVFNGLGLAKEIHSLRCWIVDNLLGTFLKYGNACCGAKGDSTESMAVCWVQEGDGEGVSGEGMPAASDMKEDKQE